MSLDLQITTDVDRAAAKVAGVPEALHPRVLQSFRTIGAALQSYVLRTELQGDPLEKRTGMLGRALFYRVTDVDRTEVLLEVGANLQAAPYARIHEYGGTIQPVHGAYLTIPLEVARTELGVARLSAREFIANPQSLGFESSFVNPKRTAILGVRQDGSIEPVFALKTQVVIPQRSYLRKALQERRTWIRDRLAHDTGAAVRELLGGHAL